MTPKQEAALRLAREALKMWWPMTATYLNARDEAVAAIDEALAEQQSGIKQVIELYDSPEQPAQQQEPVACKTLCELCVNRGYIKCANAAKTTPIPSPQPAQQQKPDGRVISVNWEYATVQWLHQTSNIGEGDPKNSRSWPIGGEDVYLSPQPSKPWVGLTDEEVDECYYWKGRQWTTDELVRHVEAKLREKNNG